MVEIVYIVTGDDGHILHIEKVFMNKRKAEEYKNTLNLELNGEYTFSVQERELVRGE